MEDNKPIFRVNYLSYVEQILNCICIRCQRIPINLSEDEINILLEIKRGTDRFREIRLLTKNFTYCQRFGCGNPKYYITTDKKNQTVFASVGNRPPLILEPRTCYDILRQVSNDGCRIMGFDPEKTSLENMININPVVSLIESPLVFDGDTPRNNF
jgi:DNA-directed RNA polymerase II subunit RPB1